MEVLKDQRNYIALESDNAFSSSRLQNTLSPEWGKNVRVQCNLNFLFHAKMHMTSQCAHSCNGKRVRNGETFHVGRT